MKKKGGKNVYSIYEARTNFSKLLKRVLSGEEIFIANREKTIAKIIPSTPAPQERLPGSAKGTFIIKDDFDAPLPQELMDSFYK